MHMNMGSHDYVQTLKGQRLLFPDLDGLVRGWPTGKNPLYEAVKEVQHAEGYQLLGPGERYNALVACDAAYNAATWWPTASFDALRFAANYVAFLYVWDNEMDSPEFSDLALNWDAGEKFREDTIKHVDAYLGDEAPGQGRVRSEHVDAALASFNPVGESGAFRLTKGQRRLFRDEVVRFITACGGEQRSELSGKAPTIKEFLDIRLGTSAVASIAATIEYMMDIDLGDNLRQDSDIKQIYADTNLIISITNDMFSLRKELLFPFYNNSVAVLYHEHRDLQVAMDEAYKLVARSTSSLERAAESVLQRFPERSKDLTAFITGAKTMITGSMDWSLHIKRYNLGVDKLDGTTYITI